MKEQWKWSCEKCRKSDIVTLEENESLMDGVYKIKDSHAKQSPGCIWDAWTVQAKKI